MLGDNFVMTSGFQPHEQLAAEPNFDEFVASVGGVTAAADRSFR